MHTSDKSNWILDRKYSDQSIETSLDEVVKNSIKSRVSSLKNEIRNTGDELLDSNSSPANQNKVQRFSLPIVNVKHGREDLNYVQKSQDWVGYVEEISDDVFRAKLFDSRESHTYETAEFGLDEVTDSDCELLKVGALFYWSIAFAYENGQLKKQSIIRFRRRFTSVDEIDRVSDEVDILKKRVKWDRA